MKNKQKRKLSVLTDAQLNAVAGGATAVAIASGGQSAVATARGGQTVISTAIGPRPGALGPRSTLGPRRPVTGSIVNGPVGSRLPLDMRKRLAALGF